MSGSFRLPDLGEGLLDAELVRWHVEVGDEVALNQVLAEVETAKAVVELPSPVAGRVLGLHAAEGETVPVGAALVTFAEPGAAPGAAPGTGPGTAVGTEAGAGTGVGAEAGVGVAPEGEGGRTAVLVGYGVGPETSSRRNGRRVAPEDAAGAGAEVAAPVVRAQVRAWDPAPAAAPARPMAKPLVRKLAREHGVDLASVRGTGAGGVVTRQDVLDHVADLRGGTVVVHRADPDGGQGSPWTVQTAPTGMAAVAVEVGGTPSPIVSEPVRGVRRATAEAMARSAAVPQATVFVTCDATPTVELMGRLRRSAFTGEAHLTVLAFVARAVIGALGRHPALNSAWDASGPAIVRRRTVNLGIATATDRGLLVPNLKDCATLDLMGLASGIARVTASARAGTAGTADLTGGTFTITNVGVFGVDGGVALLNPGEAGILCLGAVRQQPWVLDGALAVRWVTTLSLTFDHRVVDGEGASRFLADVASTLSTG